MFEQSFVQATAKTQRATPVALSLLLQASVIGTAILIPLINPDLLPSTMIANTLFLAPPTPPPAPPPRPQFTEKTVRVARQLRDGVLVAPTVIPNTVAELVEPPDVAAGPDIGDGVPFAPSGPGGNGAWTSVIRHLAQSTVTPPPPPVVTKDPERPKPPVRVRMGGKVQDAMIISRKLPDYPAMARSMRVQGTVVFQAVIGTAGTIQQLQLVSGHPLLVQAAMDAVRQWRYRPTLLNGDPTEVDTVISVTFTLSR